MKDLVFCFFFFFQAEDGIRDKLVTGVQTCLFRSTIEYAHARDTHNRARIVVQPDGDILCIGTAAYRSEERRVGKGVDLGGRRIIKKKNKEEGNRLQIRIRKTTVRR